ncbi:E3 ubiquitin-protein ligase RNF38/44 [Spatholobus suberectus]|nr:E3 ubiquitin-protein ligase RNF38/44 [Spatholobus suberectus]
MSRNMNNFTPLPGPWQRGFRSYDGHTFSDRESNEVPVFYRSRSTHATDDRSSGGLAQQRFWDFRTPLGFHGIPNFPAPPPSRQQINIYNGDMGRLREIFLQPPPRSTFQISAQVPPSVEISKSTALSKLKKVVYEPPPTQYARRVSLYYRNNNAAKSLKEKEREKDEDGKRCAICLEDFESNEEVMLTPCKHMFHEDCIVPWLTSKGQCPVCRFVICERGRGNPSSFNNNNIANLEPSDLINGELLSIWRAMEEAFQLGSITY